MPKVLWNELQENGDRKKNEGGRRTMADGKMKNKDLNIFEHKRGWRIMEGLIR